jgi:hypothetical protein
MSNDEEDYFAIAKVFPGKLNALVKNIMRQTGTKDPNEAVKLINSGKYVISKVVHNWRKKNGVIYFPVTSTGISGPQWIEDLEAGHYGVQGYARELILSDNFKPTNCVTEIAVLTGELFDDDNRTTEKICVEATRDNKLTMSTLETACIIRKTLTDKEIAAMGLDAIIVMHHPLKDHDDILSLLSVDRKSWLNSCYGLSKVKWPRNIGFAFCRLAS